MARPLRIEYEDAYYHVMNRARGSERLFYTREYFEGFLKAVEEAHDRFGLVVHAYCLMSNHYHLLLQTPQANLGRAMRHINGVFTQRFNRLRKSDGPIFRGRYKAILVDADAYLLQLSRYIHRNPIETNPPMVEQLGLYEWSSYPAYIGKIRTPDWLTREKVHQTLGKKNPEVAYRYFVREGNDEEILQYYNKGNQASVLGDQGFRTWLYEEQLPEIERRPRAQWLGNGLITLSHIVSEVAKFYKVNEKCITTRRRGPVPENHARKMAMFLSQELAGAKLKDIMKHFNLNHEGSVTYTTSKFRGRLQEEKKLQRECIRLEKLIISQAT